MTNGTATLEPKAKGKQPSGLRPGVPSRYQTDWEGYLTVSALIGDRRLRTFYTDGEMEILMPSSKHEIWISLLGRLIELLIVELRIAAKCAGMTTFRRDDLEKGLEPDRCYYISNEPKVCGKLNLDLRVDPPPDLALEVKVTSSIEKRMRIYAGLGVPEVWRFDGEKLTVNRLVANGEYVVMDRSQFFPMMPMPEWLRFMRMYEEMNETALLIAFQDWVRQQVAVGWAAGEKGKQ
jgi:Uma2 family endonuclease